MCVVIIDNARLHKSLTIVDCFHRKDQEIVYLPPDSPFLNAIEELVSKWKQDSHIYYRHMKTYVRQTLNNEVNENSKEYSLVIFIPRFKLFPQFFINQDDPRKNKIDLNPL
ncbi:hypothetical protein RF11_16250 [Thelohanellus kitauei]|uniref:Tc1-like transposase DDE domain-containing protein n=1 Tax=Thelohanellus kitauei TaxID=669202 RepID=A0A0C2M5T6_THEKT|nr:hypothetical protein RF11_16250 [Thelohanellus kitauei]